MQINSCLWLQWREYFYEMKHGLFHGRLPTHPLGAQTRQGFSLEKMSLSLLHRHPETRHLLGQRWRTTLLHAGSLHLDINHWAGSSFYMALDLMNSIHSTFKLFESICFWCFEGNPFQGTTPHLSIHAPSPRYIQDWIQLICKLNHRWSVSEHVFAAYTSGLFIEWRPERSS